MRDASFPHFLSDASVPCLVRHVANQRALPDLALALLTGDDLQAGAPDEVPNTGLAFDVIDLPGLDVQSHAGLHCVVDGLYPQEIVIRPPRRRGLVTGTPFSTCRAHPAPQRAGRLD